MRWGVAFAAAALAAASFASVSPALGGATLDRVKAAGSLHCGVLTAPEDETKSDVHGGLKALDVDLCRAVSAAVFGSPDRVAITTITTERGGFEALQTGTVDVLMGAAPAAAAALTHGVAFVRPVFFDGDGLLVRRDAGIAHFADLAERLVCYVPGTAADDVLESEAGRRKVAIRRSGFEEHGELLAAVTGGRCDALFGPVSRVAALRQALGASATEFILLPEWFSVVPMAPAVSALDPAWSEIVDAVAGAPVLAESGGISRSTAASLATTEDPLLRPLAGTLAGIDAALVPRGWGIRVIEVLGNYRELYERDIGSGSALDIPRGPNVLWTAGGLLVPPRMP